MAVSDTIELDVKSAAKSIHEIIEEHDAAKLLIIGRPNSFNVRKVLWLCDEISLPFVRIDYGRGYQRTDTPDFLEVNPAAQVPVVVDNGFVLRESNTIIRYLADKHGASHLYPEDLEARSLIQQWMDWVAYDVTHALRGAFLGGQLREAPWDHPWFIEQGRKDLVQCGYLIEAHFSDARPYVMGQAFTLADIPLGLVVNRWFMLTDFGRPDLPHVRAYYERLSTRPAFTRHGRNGLP